MRLPQTREAWQILDQKLREVLQKLQNQNYKSYKINKSYKNGHI